MLEKSDVTDSSRRRIVFLFSLIYRPLDANFIGRFALLSKWYTGHIFALSGAKQRELPVSDFLFHSEETVGNTLRRIARWMKIQIVAPIRMLSGRQKIDLVVAYDPYRCGLAALILKYVLRCKMIVEVNGDNHTNEAGGAFAGNAVQRWTSRLVLNKADAIRVLNFSQEDYYRRHFPKARLFRLPDYVATSYFTALETLQGDALLSVGMPFHRKGIDVLIKAFLRIADKHPRATLRIMGYCPESEFGTYRDLAAGCARIAFVKPGWIDEVGEEVRSCYALVNAARSEAMGRVHVEAMACAKPIVATRTNGAVVCVEDGVTGLLCNGDDVSDLAEKLDDLLSDPVRAKQLGEAGRARMLEMFSEDVYTRGFHNMIEEVIGSSRDA